MCVCVYMRVCVKMCRGDVDRLVSSTYMYTIAIAVRYFIHMQYVASQSLVVSQFFLKATERQ